MEAVTYKPRILLSSNKKLKLTDQSHTLNKFERDTIKKFSNDKL